jgi:hypothetical protein
MYIEKTVIIIWAIKMKHCGFGIPVQAGNNNSINKHIIVPCTIITMIFGVQGFQGSSGNFIEESYVQPACPRRGSPRTLEPSDPQIADGENYAL